MPVATVDVAAGGSVRVAVEDAESGVVAGLTFAGGYGPVPLEGAAPGECAGGAPLPPPVAAPRPPPSFYKTDPVSLVVAASRLLAFVYMTRPLRQVVAAPWLHPVT